MQILYVIGQSQYDSTAIFLQEMAEKMKAMGQEVTLLDGRDAVHYESQRESVIQQKYDVIITINGMLLEEDSTLGKALLQEENTIYCTYLMDHPLIHYERLKSQYPKIFVLSPDRNHVLYTDAYLPNIWGTAYLPHAGCAGKGNKPYNERRIDVSFMGSYTDSAQVRAEFGKYPVEMQQLLNAVADLLVRENELTLEQAAERCFAQFGIRISAAEMPEVMQEFRLVDRYIRSYYREQVIRTLVEAGISVDVYGDGWDQFVCKHPENLVVHPAVPYETSLDIIGDSKISLNIMPWFKDGSHDRVYTAMLCGAVCLTDGSTYLEEQLRETENVYFYSLKGLKYLPAKVRKILQDGEKSAQIAENGRRLAIKEHTWANRAEEILDYLQQLMDMEGGEEQTVSWHTFWQEVVCPDIRLLHALRRTVRYIRRQEYLYAMREITNVIDAFGALLPVWLQWKDQINAGGEILEESAVLLTLQELLEAQEKQDYILLADLLELRLIPFVTSIQEMYAGAAVAPECIGERYRIEAASSGEYTLAALSDGAWVYLHSNGDPYEEGKTLAESWFDSEHYDYVVYGLGLGYHVAGLLEMDEAVRVKVIESDPQMLQIAEQYGCLGSWMDSGRLEIVADPDFAELRKVADRMDEIGRLVIHYPSMKLIAQEHYRMQLEQYFIEYSSAQTQLPRLNGNFVRNREYFGQEVTALRERFAAKTVYIIAAGPSLDRNMMELRKVQGDAVILATGTVLKKLLKAGITPDFVIVIDGGASTYGQTKDLTEKSIPLLYLPTVYHKILAEYPGERYLICQKGLQKSEQYAKEQGYPLYESGGSVTTTAVDISIRLGCKRVVFVGLDLAYTGQRDHAADTAYAREVKQGNLLVEDIYGNPVETAKNLDIYRRWIEKRITQEDAKQVEFIDATEGGARIQGTKSMKLSEVIL
ncbi:MAG: DUF115 domain-containing protein [Eubacteriales bacterium]|nr:DUF115 domain-containing protein [Eubacteriales bacterium]